MVKRSAGLLMYRKAEGDVEVFLVHPGGPYWAKKDIGAWSIPKGEYEEGENVLEVAQREFEEETGFSAKGDYHLLGELKQPSGKRICTWAFSGDCDPSKLKSNMFEIEWPPKSGKKQQFPEADRGEWFPLREAAQRIHKGQVGFLSELACWLGIELKAEPTSDSEDDQLALFSAD